MGYKKENPSAVGAAAGVDSEELDFHDSSNDGQCLRLLMGLRKGPVTTFDAMRRLDVYYAPARVHQLRKRGHQIDTVWKRVLTEAGVEHRVGMYVLVKEAPSAPTQSTLVEQVA